MVCVRALDSTVCRGGTVHTRGRVTVTVMPMIRPANIESGLSIQSPYSQARIANRRPVDTKIANANV